MTSPPRAMARGLDDAALEALASRGLLRRAAADVAAGRAVLIGEDHDTARVSLDGETARVAAKGPGAGACSCPAPGVCRHQLAALILLRGAEGPAGAPGDPAEAAPPVDWSLRFAEFDAQRLAAFTGKADWRAVLADERLPAAAQITVEAASLSVRLGPAASPVVFPAQGGLEAALTKAPQAARKVTIALAVLAARRALGLPDVLAASPAATVPPSGPDAAVLERARDVLRRAFRAAIAFAPEALEMELRRLAVAGRVEAAPRLAGALRRLAAAFAPLRARRAEADPDHMLALMAEAYALTVALAATPDPVTRAALAGQARQDYEPMDDVVLVGLGARLWESAAGAHGVTGYFHADGLQRALSLTLARPDRTDPAFDPRQAFHQTPVWGDHPLSALCAGRTGLSGAKASASGRLSMSGATRAELAGWTPTLEGVRAWDCAHADWEDLERWLLTRLVGGLASPAQPETPAVLVFAETAAARFDELTQTLVWPLKDRLGRWIGLTLPHEGPERERIVALEAALPEESVWAVLASAQASEGRMELRPYGLWGRTQHLLDFPSKPVSAAAPASDPDALLDGLKARIRADGSRGPRSLRLAASRSERLLEQGWRLVMSGAERGRSLPSDALGTRAGALATDLAAAGLAPLARPFAALAAAPGDEEACLRAAWAVLSARRLRGRLPWMS